MQPTVADLSCAVLQDCFGGCTDADQGFYGYLDEVHCSDPALLPHSPPLSHIVRLAIMLMYTDCKGRLLHFAPMQVRIWKTARSQDDIIKWMRRSSGLEHHKCASRDNNSASRHHAEGRRHLLTGCHVLQGGWFVLHLACC